MAIDAINLSGATMQHTSKAAEQVDTSRREQKQANSAAGEADGSSIQVQPEEILNKIKALTENGEFSVRFENHNEFDELVVKVVNPKTDELIRQVPAEEVLGVRATLAELRGNIVDTSS